MPTISGKYVAPVWRDDDTPPINAAELQAMSDAIMMCDQNLDFILTAGDGYPTDGNIQTHPDNYVYLDTGETLNIDFDRSMMEIDVFGYGAAGAANLKALTMTFYYDGGSFELGFSNEFALPALSDVKFHNFWQKSMFGASIINNRVASLGNNNTAHTNSITSASAAVGKSIKRIVITGVNSNNTLLSAVLHFMKVKGRGTPGPSAPFWIGGSF